MIVVIDNFASATGAGFVVAWHESVVAPAQLVVTTSIAAVLTIVVVGLFAVVVCVRL